MAGYWVIDPLEPRLIAYAGNILPVGGGSTTARPERIRIGSPGESLDKDEVAVPGTIRDVVYAGPATRFVVDVLGHRDRRVQLSWQRRHGFLAR
jgi:hypothetical protein